MLILTAGTAGNVVRLLPPLVLERDLLDVGLDVLAQAVAGRRERPNALTDASQPGVRIRCCS